MTHSCILKKSPWDSKYIPQNPIYYLTPTIYNSLLLCFNFRACSVSFKTRDERLEIGKNTSKYLAFILSNADRMQKGMFFALFILAFSRYTF